MKQLPFAAMILAAATLTSGPVSAQGDPAPAQAEPALALSRIDCGRSDGPRDIAAFSDTHAYDGVKLPLVASCYLIRHGDDLLLWDTGYPADVADGTTPGLTMAETIVQQLAKGGLTPADIDYVGISHYHGDHTGQARAFPDAELLIGQGDWDALLAAAQAGTQARMGTPHPAALTHWIAGGGKITPVSRDHDIFGDGSVTMLAMPGHTPGHHALLVRLTSGPVMLTGDAAHFTANYDNDVVPSFNTDRADTLASLARFKQMADNLGALVVIQHEPGDVAKLPAFPEARR